MRRDDLVTGCPTLYHMAEDGMWPSIWQHGLLSTEALIDLYRPAPEVRAAILDRPRRTSVELADATLGRAMIRDQTPLKHLDTCLTDGTSPEQYLHALNSRVFFWLSAKRLATLLGARRNRHRPHTVLQVATRELVSRYGDTTQLAPYNTGSIYAAGSPRRGTEVFVDIDDYPYDTWRARRGSRADAVVELTVPYAVPDIADLTVRVDRWRDGVPVETLYER